MHHPTPTDRITHTTAFVTPVVEHWLERETAQWVQPMKDRPDYPSHYERTLAPVMIGVKLELGLLRLVKERYRSNSFKIDPLMGSTRRNIYTLATVPFTYSYFSFQPVLHDWCNKGCGMCYPVCGMVHIKEPSEKSERVA